MKVELVPLDTHVQNTGTVPMIRMKGVEKRYGSFRALHSIDLDVAHGDVVVVVGPSGSGKSTLCRTINRLEAIDAGTIEVDGEPIASDGAALARHRAKVGMVFQQFNLFSHKTVLENITLGPVHVRKEKREAARSRAHALLERVGMGQASEKMPYELSGGQQQRVAIARALAMEPKVLLFDDPTSALDPEMIKEVLDVMVDLAHEGMTMLVVTHEMGFARTAGNRVVFMADGSIIEEATPDNFFRSPASRRAQDFLAKVLHH